MSKPGILGCLSLSIQVIQDSVASYRLLKKPALLRDLVSKAWTSTRLLKQLAETSETHVKQERR
jgi:hypothetical protein